MSDEAEKRIKELTEMAANQNAVPEKERRAFYAKFSKLWDLAAKDLMATGLNFYQANNKLHNLCDKAHLEAQL